MCRNGLHVHFLYAVSCLPTVILCLTSVLFGTAIPIHIPMFIVLSAFCFEMKKVVHATYYQKVVTAVALATTSQRERFGGDIHVQHTFVINRHGYCLNCAM